MSSQNYLFKHIPSKNFIFHILEQISEKADDHQYILDKNAFKRFLFLNLESEFLTEMNRCYHWSKKHYAQKKLTYTSFARMFIQVCKLHNIQFDKGKYFVDSQLINTYLINYVCESNR